MKQVYRAFGRFLADESAHASIEYASMLAMIILTVDVSVQSLGSYVCNPFWQTSNAIAAQNNQIQNRGNPGGNGSGGSTGSTSGQVAVGT